MQPTKPNAHTYVNGTDVETMDMQSHGTLFEQSCTFPPVTIPVHRGLRNMEEGGVLSVECGVWSVKYGV